ncbi:MAG: HAMP domain-containing histidine kinase [Lachnospiraceae bacterium]|nr:HAMP domain-containing histidine kinase [Lachnospiraceae bacterium]
MKHSIKNQFALIFSVLLALAIAGCFLANTLLLDDFYISSKKTAIIKAYSQINSAAAAGDIRSDDFSVTFEQIAARDNLEILILDSDTRTILSTGRDTKNLTDRLLGYFFKGADKADTLYEGQSLYVQRSMDPVMKMEYIELWGLLDNNNMIFMRTPLESIRDSVQIANRFLAYAGIAVIVIGVVLTGIFAGKVTGPIMKLADISERVARLDFDAKYDESGREDEIAVLGRSINKMSENLEQTISELKTANNELQLDIARKTELENKRREFISNVSHELKTPIAVIQGYAEGLKDCVNDDAESRDYYCEVIMDEASKMNRMVQQLLMLDQIESGSDVVAFERFDLMKLVNDCMQADAILIGKDNITVNVNPKEPVYVWSDPLMIEQVVNNYLSNAIHYASGEKVIDITATRTDGVVRLKVFNTGEPIPEESLDQLWTKFYKVDKARTREYGGSGIGLSIVKAIAESLNRECGVDNYDNGVAFWFDMEQGDE